MLGLLICCKTNLFDIGSKKLMNDCLIFKVGFGKTYDFVN